MPKLKCTIRYDGTNFSGFQVQPNKRTVQGEVERALQQMHHGTFIRINGSGRTDAGVHAKGQVFHFNTPLEIPLENWKKALNSLLADDLYIVKVEEVSDDFHAQFDAVEKEYRYFVLNEKERDIFRRHYTYHYPYDVDLALIKHACKMFEGTHDFTSFSSARSAVKGTKVRTLTRVDCKRKDDELVFILRGDGFLYNMVRIIVGMLLDVGSGVMKLEDIETIFQKKDRRFAGKTLPPNGLFLWEVTYRDS